MESKKLKSIIESILFTSGEAMTVGHISKIISEKKGDVGEAIDELSKEYQEKNGGLSILKKGDSVQMVTNPDNAQHVQELVKNELYGNLSKTALETLAIIAYREPVSRSDIDAIRGVNSNFILRNLLVRGLIERADNPNDARGYIYQLSTRFMKKMGITNVSDLPDFEKFSQDKKIEAIIKGNESK